MGKCCNQIGIDLWRKTFHSRKQRYKKKSKASDQYGNYIKYIICESTYFLTTKCSDKNNAHNTHIILRQSYPNSDCCFKRSLLDFLGQQS